MSTGTVYIVDKERYHFHNFKAGELVHINYETMFEGDHIREPGQAFINPSYIVEINPVINQN